MNKTANRFLSMMLALVMSFSCLPGTSCSVYAEEESGQEEEIAEIEDSSLEEAEPEEIIEVQEDIPQEQTEGNIPESVIENDDAIPSEEMQPEAVDSEQSADIMAMPVTDEIQSGRYVVMTTDNVTIMPEYSARISWTAGFTPVKIKIMYYYSIYTGPVQWAVDTITIKTLSGTAASCILTYSEAEAARSQVPDGSNLLEYWYVYAYYGSGDTEYVSAKFYVNLSPREVEMSADDVSISPDSSGKIAWTANFTPVKSKIVCEHGSYAAWYNYSDQTVKTISGSATSCDLSYTEAETALKNTPTGYSVDYTNWYVYVYYGSGSKDYVVKKFDLKLVDRKVTLTSGYIPVLPNQAGQLSWSTNFIQKKVQIVYSYIRSFDFELKEIILKTYTGSSTGCLIYDSEVQETLAKVDSTPLNGGSWSVRVFYGSGSNDYESGIFYVLDSEYAFTSSPSDITISPDHKETLNWKLNFKPKKIEIYGQESVRWFKNAEITDSLTESGKYELSYGDADPRMKIRAYYSENDYIDSQVFSVTIEPYQFTKQPDNYSVSPSGSAFVNWKTNFTPKQAEYGYVSGSEWVTVITQTIFNYDSQGYIYKYIEYDDAYPAMYIRVWYDDEHYIYSQLFTIAITPRKFTSDPQGTTISPGDTLTLNWKTNFIPDKVDILYYSSDRWIKLTELTSGLSQNMSHPLAYDDVYERMELRAWYGSDYFCYSDVVVNEVIPRQFTAQPSGAAVYPWQPSPLSLSFTVNFDPVKYNVGYRDSRTGAFMVTKEITADLSRSMNQPMNFDELINGAMYVRAFYGTGTNNYVTSEAFTIEKYDEYVCGDSLTATFDLSSGVLTFAGTGAMYNYSSANHAPWFDIISYIKEANIPDGVTYIGSYAFHACSSMHTLRFTPSVTEVGTSADYDCTSLRWVSYGGFKNQWDQIKWNYGNSRIQSASVGYLSLTGKLNSDISWGIYGHKNLLEIDGSGEIPRLEMPWNQYGAYIENVRIWDGITKIGEENFRECTAVKTVYLPGTLTYVDDAAFNYCKKLSDVYFDGPVSDWNNITIRPDNDPLTNASLHTAAVPHYLTDDLAWSVDDSGLLRIFVTDEFMGSGDDTAMPNYTDYTEAPWYSDYADVITSVYVEPGVTRIGNYAFGHLSKLKTLEVGNTVTSIGNKAFSACRRLEDFTLPDSVVRIGTQAFSDCSYLEVLHLPESIMTLGSGAFAACSNLEKVWLPEKIVTIQDSVFLNDSLLDMIYIPSTVKYINQNVFSGCTALMDENSHVYYNGTSAQWKAITIYSGNDSLINAGNIHFNPEELKIDAVNFPDTQFRSYVSNIFDTDSSGWLTDAELADAADINDEENDYTNLKGIELFPNITGILIDAAPSLKSVDLSANKELTYVDFSGCGNLEEINLSGLTKLQMLYLSDNNLSEIDLSGLTNLEVLSISRNPVSQLDLSVVSLKELYAANMPSLSGLDISDQTELCRLYCYGSGIKELDLTYSPDLMDVYINGTKASRTMDGIPYVEYEPGSTNHVLAIDPDCICYTEHSGIRIDSVNFPDPDFRRYVASYWDTNRSGWLSEEEISGVTNIIMEEDYDVHNMEGIEYFSELTSLLVDSNPNLTVLDLRANAKLTGIEVWDNGLTDLNISGLVNLENLFVDGNELTALDVSEFNLVNLECYDNPLTELVLGEQQTLKSLYCYGTGLKELNISQCPILVQAFNGEKTERDSYIEYSISSPSGTLRIDRDLNVIGPLDIRVDEEHFPDEAFRNYVAANIDENHNGYLNEAEREAVEALDLVYENTVTGITSLQGIEYFPEMTYLAVSDSPDLKEMDLSANTKLLSIDIWDTGLESLDVSPLKVESISCSRNELDELVLGEQPDLIFLGCYGNEFDTLDLSGCPKLIDTVQNGTKTNVTNNGIACTEYVLGESGLNGYLIVDQNTWLYLSEPHLPDSISIDPVSTGLTVGDTKQLNVNFAPAGTEDYIIWSSSDSAVATVSDEGLVTAVSAGAATITVTTANGVTAECIVNVTEKEEYIIGINAALELRGSTNLLFYLEVPESQMNSTIHMTLGKRTKDVKASDGALTEDGTRMYKFPVYSTQMKENVVLTVTGEDGQPKKIIGKGSGNYLDSLSYSVQRAIDYYKKNYTDGLEKVAKAMEDYGTCAQIQFTDNVESLSASDEVKAVTKEDLSAYEPKGEASVPGMKLKTMQLELMEDIGIIFRYSHTAGELSDYKFTVDGKEAKVLKAGENEYAVKLSKLAANKLDEAHEFRVEDSNGNSQTITFSALSYAQMAVSGSYGENIENLSKALYLYSEAANAYFGD